MSESNGPALGEVAEAFGRAREELTKISGQLREFDAIAEQRRDEQASIETASEQLRGAAGSIASVIQRLDGVVGQVEDVLVAAKSALQATDSGQLMDRLDALEGRIASQEKAVGERVDNVQRAVDLVATGMQKVAGQGEAVGERVDTMKREVALVTVGMEKVADQDQTRLALQNENRRLREQLDLVRAGLKPRQLEALGLQTDGQPRA